MRFNGFARARAIITFGAAALIGSWIAPLAHAADPIRIGLSLSLTGPTSPAG